ncbi:hypothetical protein ACHAW6_013282 [Cyclotella cf. meneghiniana]
MQLHPYNLAAAITSLAIATQSANDTVSGVIISSFFCEKYLLPGVGLKQLGDRQNMDVMASQAFGETVKPPPFVWNFARMIDYGGIAWTSPNFWLPFFEHGISLMATTSKPAAILEFDDIVVAHSLDASCAASFRRSPCNPVPFCPYNQVLFQDFISPNDPATSEVNVYPDKMLDVTKSMSLDQSLSASHKSLEHLNLRNDKPNTCLIADSFLADDNIVSFAPSFVGKSAGKMEWICSIDHGSISLPCENVHGTGLSKIETFPLDSFDKLEYRSLDVTPPPLSASHVGHELLPTHVFSNLCLEADSFLAVHALVSYAITSSDGRLGEIHGFSFTSIPSCMFIGAYVDFTSSEIETSPLNRFHVMESRSFNITLHTLSSYKCEHYVADLFLWSMLLREHHRTA